MTVKGNRRRSLGGVFFKLVKEHTTTKERRAIFPHLNKAFQRTRKRKGKPPAPPTAEAVQQAIIEIIKEPGEALMAKMTLIGRPGRVLEKGSLVLTSMEGSKAPSLPKGLPDLPQERTTYIIYIALKQWRKVREAIKNPEDRLIVEGYPVFDPRIGSKGTMTLYAQNTTTKLLQQARREAQQKG